MFEKAPPLAPSARSALSQVDIDTEIRAARRAAFSAADHFEHRVALFRRQGAAPGSIVMLGDSLTEDFDLGAFLPGRPLLNRGIAADHLDHPSGYAALHRLTPELLAPSPALIAILLGINDLSRGVTVPEAIVALAALLDRLKLSYPDAQLLCQSLTPARGSFQHLQPLIVDFNAKLKVLAHAHGAGFLDLHAALRDRAGRLCARFSRDGLHLSSLAYRVWAQRLAQHLAWPQPALPAIARAATRKLARRLAASTPIPHDLGASFALPDPSQPLTAAIQVSVPTLVRAQIERTPNAPALLDAAGGELSYAQLGAASSALAAQLQAAGVARGDVVAVWATRACSLVWSLLGILESGAAFAVLDRTYPPARLAAQLEQSGAKYLLVLEAAGALPVALTTTLAGCKLLHVPAQPGPATGPEAPPAAVGGDDVAYVAFTSGTTGQPRAIVGTHAPLTHFLRWHIRSFGFGQSDCFALTSGLAHDPLLRDVFTPLACGARLVVPNNELVREPDSLRALLSDERVSALHLTPSFAELLTHARESDLAYKQLPGLRWAFFGGEALQPATLERFRALAPNATCIGFYGATETPQAVGHCVIERQPRSKPNLGRGIADTQLLVLDASGRARGVREIGEICVRSPYLAQRYLGDPELSARRFVTNAATGCRHDRVYRTGDRGRYLADGSIEFLGRSDRQIKLRGFRIELDDVEAALASHPAVTGASVDCEAGSSRLLAYAAVSSPLSAAALREYLQLKLPEHMLPSAIVVVDALPLTPNGKVDRATLATRYSAPLDPATAQPQPQEASSTVQRLAELWSQVLERPQLGGHANFFDLGGDSLRGLTLLARIEERFGKRLPVHSLMQHPTLGQLAKLLDPDAAEVAVKQLVPIRRGGDRAPVYWLPGGGGLSVMAFMGVSQRLGLARPVYGLEAELDANSAPHTLSEIVARYREQIQLDRPHGPYHLFGFSLGSFVAYELALQLQAAGAEVGLLAVFDTGVPSARMQAQRRRVLMQRALFQARTALHAPRATLPGLIALGAEHLRPLWQRGTPPPPSRFDAIIRRNIQATRVYAGQPLRTYQGKITCVLARQTSLAGVDPEIDPRLEWRHSATQGIDVHHVNGNHLSMLEAPDVDDLGAVLRLCLRNYDLRR